MPEMQQQPKPGVTSLALEVSCVVVGHCTRFILETEIMQV